MVLRQDWIGYYTWSFKRFKSWKKEFQKKFKETYDISFNEYVEDAKDREYIYKEMFRMQSIDVFWTWNFWAKVEIEKIKKCQEIVDFLWN